MSNYAEILKRKKEEALEKTASLANNTMNTNSSYLSLSDMALPDKLSDIFKWCKYFYSFDPLIHGAINALATFPITTIQIQDSESWTSKDADVEDKSELKRGSSLYNAVKDTMFEHINIYKLMVEIGIDYQLYGNCIIIGEIGNAESANEDEGTVKTWRSIRRIPVNLLVIEQGYNGEKKFKMAPSYRIQQIVKNKQPADIYKSIPDVIKKAVIEDKLIELNNEYIYHFSKPTDSYNQSSWGLPGIANVLKLLMYRNVLRRAQEAIAKEHIVPFRIFFLNPANGNVGAAVGSAIGSNVPASPNSLLAGEIRKHAEDPNYQIVSNVPVGMVTAGGHGRGLLLTPEIEQVQSEILAGLNTPREFIFGGVSYSGSSVSLKILENHFITYRLLLTDFLNNFIIKKLARARGEWSSPKDNDRLVKASMLDLKMQDDVQQKQMLLNLNASGKIADAMLVRSFGMDPEVVIAELKEDISIKAEMDRIAKLHQIDTETKLKKAMVIQSLELQVFEQQLEIYQKANGLNQIHLKKVDDIISDIEGAVPPKSLDIDDAQQQLNAQRSDEERKRYIEMVNLILNDFERDAFSGQSMLTALSKKLGSKDLSMIYDILTSHPDIQIKGLNVQPLLDVLDSAAFESAGVSISQQKAQQAAEEQAAAVAAGEIPPEAATEAAEGAGAPAEESGSGENIDMRPMPEQRPPRRETLG